MAANSDHHFLSHSIVDKINTNIDMSPEDIVILTNIFKEIRAIGRGSVGQVYSAIDVNTGDMVALKLLPSNLNFRSVIMDGCITKNLTCPHVISPDDLLYVLYNESYYFCIVMKYYHDPLNTEMTTNLKFALNVEIMYNLALGVNCLHDNDILHGDIKLHNIVMDYDENGSIDPNSVTLIDFGITQINTSSASNLLQITYSLPYRPPEVFLGVGYGLKSDIWALGVLFYAILTGGYLFDPRIGVLGRIFYKRGNPSGIFKGFDTMSDVRSVTTIPPTTLVNASEKWSQWDHRILYPKQLTFSNLLNGMLELDPTKRYDIKQVLSHDLFNKIKISRSLYRKHYYDSKVDNYRPPINIRNLKPDDIVERNRHINQIFNIWHQHCSNIDTLPYAIMLYDYIKVKSTGFLVGPDIPPLIVIIISTAIIPDKFKVERYYKTLRRKYQYLPTRLISEEELIRVIFKVIKDINCQINFSTPINQLNLISDKFIVSEEATAIYKDSEMLVRQIKSFAQNLILVALVLNIPITASECFDISLYRLDLISIPIDLINFTNLLFAYENSSPYDNSVSDSRPYNSDDIRGVFSSFVIDNWQVESFNDLDFEQAYDTCRQLDNFFNPSVFDEELDLIVRKIQADREN